MEVKPRLIIGLGNPGKKYEKTYHNIGFLFINYLINYQSPPTDCQLLKTNVYMNQSGGFVKKMLKKYKTNPEELLIVHDDSDIELGKYKISFGRGSAGHRGVESIIKSLGTKNFWRLRIGIRSSSEININQHNYQRQSITLRRKASGIVLKKINKRNWKIFEEVFHRVANSLLNLNQDRKD